jgi:NAD(P)-dependent dehydrogenase (short-subunit alcohol dehydrogenase family)
MLMEEKIPFHEFDLSGKVAVVTGAGRGLGNTLALSLAKYGADLAICSRTTRELEALAEKVEKTYGRKVLIQETDVTDSAGVERMVALVEETYGHIDILVNNAGMNIPQWAEEITEDAWDQVINVNLKGVLLCAQAVGKVMIRQKKGKIINVSSQTGSVALPQRSAYCASKGGVNQLTKVLALEWAKHNICVNAIAPTFLEGKWAEATLKEKKYRDYIFSKILLGRLAKPEDISGAVIYLASAASDMVTGHILLIDGGWTIH